MNTVHLTGSTGIAMVCMTWCSTPKYMFCCVMYWWWCETGNMTSSFHIAHCDEYLSFAPKRTFRELDLLQPTGIREGRFVLSWSFWRTQLSRAFPAWNFRTETDSRKIESSSFWRRQILERLRIALSDGPNWVGAFPAWNLRTETDSRQLENSSFWRTQLSTSLSSLKFENGDIFQKDWE
jgi:hypothetical protein